MRHCATIRKVAVLILNDVFEICHLVNTCGPNMALGSPQMLIKLSTWNMLSLPVSMVNVGWRRISGYSWTCHQRVTVWILSLQCFHGIAREYCNDLSHDGCHNMKLLTIQEAPFVSVLTEKLVVSELVRIFTLFHGTRN